MIDIDLLRTWRGQPDSTGLIYGAYKCAKEGHTSPKHLIADGKHRGVMNCVRCGFRMYVD